MLNSCWLVGGCLVSWLNIIIGNCAIFIEMMCTHADSIGKVGVSFCAHCRGHFTYLVCCYIVPVWFSNRNCMLVNGFDSLFPLGSWLELLIIGIILNFIILLTILGRKIFSVLKILFSHLEICSSLFVLVANQMNKTVDDLNYTFPVNMHQELIWISNTNENGLTFMNTKNKGMVTSYLDYRFSVFVRSLSQMKMMVDDLSCIFQVNKYQVLYMYMPCKLHKNKIFIQPIKLINGKILYK